MNVKIRNKFIEIKYSVSNGLVIFITKYWWFRILEIIHTQCISHKLFSASVLAFIFIKDTKITSQSIYLSSGHDFFFLKCTG